MLGQQFIENKKYQEFLKSNFVVFLADSATKEGDEIFEKFNVRATPTVMIVNSKGEEIDWHVGYGPPASKFQERLEKTLRGEDTFQVLYEKYQQDPDNVEVVFLLARKWDRRYNQEKAKELYNRVLELDPDGSKGTTDYLDKGKVTFTEYAEFSLGTMQVFSRERDIKPLRAFLEKYPKSLLKQDTYSYLSSYYRSAGTKEEAIQFFEEYAAMFPDNPYALNAYIDRIIRDKGDIDRGIELAEKINNEIMKYNPDPYFVKNQAELLMLKDDKDEAESVYGKNYMEGQVSDLAYNLREYADFWVEKDMNLESAEEMIRLAVELKPDNSYIIQSASRIYIKLDKLEKALALYGSQYADKNMENSDLLYSYARFWASQGENLESALKAAQKAVDLDAAYYKWDTLALVYQKLERYEEAIKAEEKAIETAGDYAERFKNRLELIKKEMAKAKKKG